MHIFLIQSSSVPQLNSNTKYNAIFVQSTNTTRYLICIRFPNSITDAAERMYTQCGMALLKY